MFYKTWYINYHDKSYSTGVHIKDYSPFCVVFSDEMAKYLVDHDSNLSIDTVSGLSQDDILNRVYHDIMIIDDLVYNNPVFAKLKFRILDKNNETISDYYPLSNYRNSRLKIIGV